jgi:Family of unknown function (DUF5715)
MRCLHPYLRSFAGTPALWLPLLLWWAVLLCPGIARAARHRALTVGHHASSRPHILRVASHPHGRTPRLLHVRRRREHHVRPHTARALKHARHRGTEAVRQAARAETQRVASGESTDEAPESASLKLPERPLAIMNLPPLRGTHESLVRQNERAEQDGLLRVKDDADLNTLRHAGSLVALPETASMHVDGRLPMNRRYCRTWTGQFLADLARAHYERFHTPLQVNSAVRTIEYQRHLLHINGNAAPAEGDVASPHLTGAAVDIAKKGLSRSEVAWMRAYLLPLQMAGKIDVEEEFKQSCFHISVYKAYGTPRNDVAAGGKPAALLASRMR